MREGLLGWATDALVRLDDETSGVIARTLTAAPGRKQAIFAALAVGEVKAGVFGFSNDLIPTSLGEVIRHGRSADILRHALGEVPEGLPGLLARVGDRPLPRAKDYIALHDLLVSGDARGADALRASGRITCRKLDVLAALDVRWRHSNTLERIDTAAEALTFNAAVAFIQSVNSKATDEAVAEAIAQMRPSSTLARLLDRFLRRADRMPPHPVPVGDNELRPLATVRALMEAGRKYRNCLSHRLADVAAGKLAIAEYRDCLVEFRPMTLGAGWLLRDVHAARNGPVPLELANAVEAKCDALGIPRIDEAVNCDGWKNYRRFTQELEWG
ncbi:hypothetical protein N0B44_33910 [Roseibacterium beibuensis]|uniref:hypothetical protein n=1 Tax=[Roseibacterium] beibuensis TaxID=1193142 RepID=UPI00217D5BB2|nr:hypothetical protein [Roseibacterium beibuensis]MCS6627909.1 hypothetical protein [Roseibacterium beibuensis]